MKAIIITIIGVLTLFSANAQQQGKYIFTKSGHIEYNLTGSTVGKKSVWYDDYGIKMATLTESTSTVKMMGITNTTKVKELEIRNGNQLWKINLLDNTGTKTTIDYAIKSGKALTDNKSDAELHQMERQTVIDLGGSIEGYENILGKKCMVFTLGTTKFWQYKGYPLKSIISMLGLTNNETAISFEENITVPASKFAIPAGVTITEGVNPMDGDLGGLLNGLQGMNQEEEQEADDEEPLQTSLTYPEFIKAIKGIKVQGFSYTMGEQSKGSYVSMFRIGSFYAGASVFNLNLFDHAEEGEPIDVQKTYTLNGKQAKYAYTHEGENETPMHALFIKNQARKLTLVIHAQRDLPLSTMEEIARQLNF